MKRIDKKSSRTAAFTCMSRAAAYYERNPYYHVDDYIAPRMLPKILKFLLKFHLINFRGRWIPKGIYEYVIARTKYIDEVLKRVVEEKFDQIAILGAGYDSRGIRFLENSQIKLFELDSPMTQEGKIKQMKKRKISVPDRVNYIGIDFKRQSLRTKLKEAGFRNDKKCLFILEGIVMYLDEESVKNTFDIIRECSSKGSLILFDYVYSSILRGENRFYGEAEIMKKVSGAGEAWTFGIEEGEVETFLKDLGFRLLEHYNAHELEDRYFTPEKGDKEGRINGTHSIVLAEV
jgi:methyltransferase (TIGR00027 family)